jgi:uncharacterized repeat protein (TIGR01451 family)
MANNFIYRYAWRLVCMLWMLGCCAAAHGQIQRSIVNPSFELPFTGPRAAALNVFFTKVPPDWISVDAGEIPGWETSHPIQSLGCPAGNSLVTTAYNCTPIELWANSFQSVVPASGIVLAELNAYVSSKLFQNICMNTGESFSFNFAHRGRGGADQAQLQIGASAVVLDVTTNTSGTGVINAGGGAVSTSATGIAGGWTRYAGTYTYTGASGVQPLGFSAISSAGGPGSGNLLDDINIGLKPYIEFVGATSSSVEGGSPSAPRIKVVGVVPAGGLVLTLAVSGSAAFGSDFNYSGATTLTGTTGAGTSLSVTVPPGNYSDATANNIFTLPLNTLNDTVVEDNETVVFTMPANGPSTPFVNANSTVCGGTFNPTLTHTIIDNDMDLRATKSVAPTGSQAVGSTVTYTLVYANVTPAVLTIAPLTAHNASQVAISDTPPAGVTFTSWTCAATGTTCPAASGSGAITATANLPVGAQLVYTVQAALISTSLCEQTVTNTSIIATTASSPSGVTLTEGTSVQGNAGYVFAPNTATASNPVQACAALSVTKTNNTTTLSAGQTTVYNLVITNSGPSSANNALVKDPAAPGLACTAVACTAATGAASCASLGAVNMPLLQGSGIVLNNFPAGSSYTFQVTCGVTATGP